MDLYFAACQGLGLALAAGVFSGASAQREFDRRKAKRDARIDERFGLFAGVVRAVTVEPQSTRSWATGAVGEQRVATALAAIPGVNVLHDRQVPGTRGNIDHIVIAPAGVFTSSGSGSVAVLP